MSEAIWYRYVDILTDVGVFDDGEAMGVEIVAREYRVKRETPKGVWLFIPWDKPKFVLNEARRRFAYPTKELALDSLRIRKSRQIGHAKATLERAQSALRKIASMQKRGVAA